MSNQTLHALDSIDSPKISQGRRRAISALYLAAVALFLASVASFYTPGRGFTYLIGFGDQFDQTALPAIREVPHYVHKHSSGYDGQFYAQLAVEPLLRNKAIDKALDTPAYRARRILFSWTAFALGLGRPSWIINIYAGQNIVCWLLLAWLLVRWFPPVTMRSFALWFGCLYSYGLVMSVHYSLLDGPSMLLLAVAVALTEKDRLWLVSAALGLAGLARETNLLGGVVLIRPDRWGRREVARLVVLVCVIVLPLALWFDYVRSVYHSLAYTGGDNLGLPFKGYLDKWESTLAGFRFGWASRARYSLLGLISLTAQALYLICRRDSKSAWWRLGMVYSVLMIQLEPSVWEGDPGAALRVLLPMTVAFNVLLLRDSRCWFWPLFGVGNLTVLQGLEAVLPRAIGY